MLLFSHSAWWVASLFACKKFRRNCKQCSFQIWSIRRGHNVASLLFDNVHTAKFHYNWFDSFPSHAFTLIQVPLLKRKPSLNFWNFLKERQLGPIDFCVPKPWPYLEHCALRARTSTSHHTQTTLSHGLANYKEKGASRLTNGTRICFYPKTHWPGNLKAFSLVLSVHNIPIYLLKARQTLLPIYCGMLCDIPQHEAQCRVAYESWKQSGIVPVAAEQHREQVLPPFRGPLHTNTFLF